MASTKGLAAVGVALLGIGFTVGWLAAPGAGLAPAPAPKTVYLDSLPTTRQEPVAPPRAPAAAAPVPKEPEVPATSLLGDADRDALRALLEKVPAVDVAKGTGAITGRVLDGEGRPLEGVDVALIPDHPLELLGRHRPNNASLTSDPVDSALQSYRNARWNRSAYRRTKSDAAGAFRVEGLADENHQIWATKSGWIIHPRNYRVSSNLLPGADIEMKASRVVEIRVEVLLPDGSPAASSRVSFAGSPTGYAGEINPRTPMMSVQPGSYTVSATSGENEELKSASQAVEVPADGEPPVVRLQLIGRPGIRGRVVLPEGERSGTITVYARMMAAGSRVDPASMRNSSKSAHLSGDHDGYRFQFLDLLPGRYAVGATRTNSGPMAVIGEVDVGNGVVSCELPMPSPERSDYVVVRVIGPDGKPETDGTLGTGVRTERGSRSSSSGGRTSIVRPDGSMWVFHHDTGSMDVDDATHWVEFQHSRYGTVKGEYKRGSQDELTLRYQEAATVEARVTGADGSPYLGRLALDLVPAAEEKTGTGFRHGEERGLDAGGVRRFDMVQPGDFILVLGVSTESRTVNVSKTPIAVRAGKNDVAVALPPLHSVTVTGGPGGVSLRRSDDRYFSLQRTFGKDGRVVFDALPEGEYTATCGGKHETFRLPGTEEVKF